MVECQRMVDIHSHILPAVDDGARSWEMAVEMCQMAAEDGIDHIVATPHANNEFKYERARLRGMLDELRQRVDARLTLSLGCDFHLSYDNLERLAEEPDDYTIEKTPYLLVELSDYSIPPTLTNHLEGLLRAGLRPIITHPERNPLLARHPDRVFEWIRSGCAVQVTASALTGKWGRTPKQVAHWLIQIGAAHILATDSHDVRKRQPNLSGARDIVARKYGANVAKALVDDNPRAVVEDQPLPYFPRI
jgi:protein-tyrosine phosphatase